MRQWGMGSNDPGEPETNEAETPPPPKPKQSGTPTIWIATAVIAALIILGFVYWRFFLVEEPRAAAPKAPVAAVVDAGTPGPVNLADGDAIMKAEGGGLSTDAILAQWLGQPDLVRRAVAATFQISRGESPRELLSFMSPGGIFSVDEEHEKAPLPVKAKGKKRPAPKPKGHSFMSAKSAARYDVVGRVIGSVDTAAMGRLYAKLRPFADAAFREVGPPDKKFDDTFFAAVDHLAAVPISDERLEVVPFDKAVGYAFADPKLEALTPAQKHLLRMGPANARTVVKKLQEFRVAAFGAAP